MPKYDVWFTIRGHNQLKETVTAKNKEEAKHIIRREWYGENADVKQIKGHKAVK